MSIDIEDLSVSSADSGTARNRLSEAKTSSGDAFKLLATYQLTYSIVGLVAGLVCMLIGVGLYIRQVTESIGWIAGESKLWGYLFEAIPGVALLVAGLLIVYLTRLRLSDKIQQPGGQQDGNDPGNRTP